jgi:hypothetical protein
MIGDERGEFSAFRAATSRSVTLRPPSLAMLPVSTRMDETDMAPGVRAPDGTASRRSLRPASTKETVEPEGDATGVGSPCGVAALAVSSPCPAEDPSRLIARLAGLEPPLLLPASLLVDGLPPALELLGLTTFSGTVALPPPRLATRGLSSSANRLPPALERGFAGAKPNDPPSGKRGFSSAFCWKREILSDTLTRAPVWTDLPSLPGEPGDEEVGGVPSPSLAMRSASLPVCAILSGVDLRVELVSLALRAVEGKRDGHDGGLSGVAGEMPGDLRCVRDGVRGV